VLEYFKTVEIIKEFRDSLPSRSEKFILDVLLTRLLDEETKLLNAYYQAETEGNQQREFERHDLDDETH
jgi:hypothetical protein